MCVCVFCPVPGTIYEILFLPRNFLLGRKYKGRPRQISLRLSENYKIARKENDIKNAKKTGTELKARGEKREKAN